jgi:hypothetical protein
MTSNASSRNFDIIWLDPSVKTDGAILKAQQVLRTTLTTHIEAFSDASKCHNHIKSLSTENQIVLIVSGQLGRELVPAVHELPHILAIYVFCMNQQAYKQWSSEFQKVRQLFFLFDYISPSV